MHKLLVIVTKINANHVWNTYCSEILTFNKRVIFMETGECTNISVLLVRALVCLAPSIPFPKSTYSYYMYIFYRLFLRFIALVVLFSLVDKHILHTFKTSYSEKQIVEDTEYFVFLCRFFYILYFSRFELCLWF